MRCSLKPTDLYWTPPEAPQNVLPKNSCSPRTQMLTRLMPKHVLSHFPFHTPHFTLSTSHHTLSTSHFTFNTPHSTLHTPQFTPPILQSTLRTPHSTFHTPHFTLHTPQFALHTPHFPLHTPHRRPHRLDTPHPTFYYPHFTLHTQHFILHSTLPTSDFTLHTSHAPLHTTRPKCCACHAKNTFATSKSTFPAMLPSFFETSRNCHTKFAPSSHFSPFDAESRMRFAKKRNSTRLKRCAGHEKWTCTSPKCCCACQGFRKCKASSANLSIKVLRLPRKMKLRNVVNLEKWLLFQHSPLFNGTAIQHSRECQFTTSNRRFVRRFCQLSAHLGNVVHATKIAPYHHLTQRKQCDLQQTRSSTHLKRCACHEKGICTRPKCCASHAKWKSSSENMSEVLRVQHKPMFDTLGNTSGCHKVTDRLASGTAIQPARERLRTVADGCEHKRNVEQTHPQGPSPRVKWEPLVRMWEKGAIACHALVDAMFLPKTCAKYHRADTCRSGHLYGYLTVWSWVMVKRLLTVLNSGW